jgi:hypothetical protein
MNNNLVRNIAYKNESLQFKIVFLMDLKTITTKNIYLMVDKFG